MILKQLATLILCIGLLGGIACGQPPSDAPKTLIHFVTLKWKTGTTPEQIQAALDGAHELAKEFKGILRVWTKTVSAQGDKTQVIAMEFADAAALKAYSGSDAQKKWYAVYLPIREESTTFDVSN